jgi:uncharacterized protein YueI
MSQLIYNKDRTQVYLGEFDKELIVDIDEHSMHNNVSSRLIFAGDLRYEYCENFLKINFSIDLDNFIKD